MKKTAGLIICLFLAAAAGAEVFKITDPILEPKKNLAYDKASGKTLWRSTIKVTKFSDKGKDFLYITENGSGTYGQDRKEKNWDSQAYYFYDGSTAVPYQGKLIFKSPAGKILQTVERSFDREGKILFRSNGKDTLFDRQGDLIDKDLLGLALSHYPFAEKRDFTFHLLTNEPKIYPMTIKYLGEETLLIGGKEIVAYKLQMIPDLGALNIFGAFVPKTYFWFTKNEPHDFLRYEGLESGLGTPYIVIEAERKS
ncbi:MAG: hypothetical protein WCW67_00435 [Candidatus Margulisiibacteriota bacterium]